MTHRTLALMNGKVWTGSSFVSSIIVSGGHIASLGEDVPSGAEVIDLQGRLVVPGFIDNHVHFTKGSTQLDEVQLRDAGSLAEFSARIAERAQRTSSGQWITGGGWDEQRWSPGVPSRNDIDPITRDHPVFVTRHDLHMGLANLVALRRAGITRDTPDPEGGAIVRDSEGEPTGLLKDAAMDLVTRIIPPRAQDDRLAALRKGLREAARCGVTSFCDMGTTAEAFDDLRAYQRLERLGELTARAWMYLPIVFWEKLAGAGIEKGFGSSRLRIAGLKGFSDGSLGSATAAFRQPMLDHQAGCGLLMKPMLDGSMKRWVAGADEHDLQLAIHAIGDRANDEVLTLLESRPDSRARRFRIEHAQHLDAGLVRRFADSGVIASMQPFHAADDGRWAESRIGQQRATWAFPFRSLLDAGAIVTFGSDWPVAPLDPILGIHAAVTRRTIDGRNRHGWIPEQKVTVHEALRCYTATNAWAIFAERELGRIAPGMRADLVVLSGDLFTIAPEEIEDVRVDMTIFDGKVIFEA